MQSIDDVIDYFNEYLDEYNDEININGVKFAPSEVLYSMSETQYMRMLDRFIDDRYEIYTLDDDDVMYKLLGDIDEQR